MNKLGVSLEFLVASRYAAVGCCVSLPFTDCRYDLVVDNGSHLYRVQVKKAHKVERRRKLVGWGDRPHYSADLMCVNNSREPYNLEDFDYLSLVCEEDLVYNIPIGELASPESNGKVVHTIRVKLEDPTVTREDARAAIARFASYKNNWRLPCQKC